MDLDEVAEQHTQHKTEHSEPKEGHHERKKTKTDIKNYVIVALATALIVLGLVWIRDSGNSTGPSDAALVPSQPSAAPVPTVKVDMDALVDDDPFMGKENAPVTIIEWSDYECPFCKRFYDQTLPQIKSEYIDTGKVKFVYRDFPLSFHQNAHIEAQAAECAKDQGGDTAYFKYHDVIFKRTISNGLGIAVDQLPVIARDIGIDVTAFNTCLNSGKFKAEVDKDFSDGSAAGIQGTPGFIINGKLVSGAQPFSVFKQIIDAELT